MHTAWWARYEESDVVQWLFVLLLSSRVQAGTDFVEVVVVEQKQVYLDSITDIFFSFFSLLRLLCKIVELYLLFTTTAAISTCLAGLDAIRK